VTTLSFSVHVKFLYRIVWYGTVSYRRQSSMAVWRNA